MTLWSVTLLMPCYNITAWQLNRWTYQQHERSRVSIRRHVRQLVDVLHINQVADDIIASTGKR